MFVYVPHIIYINMTHLFYHEPDDFDGWKEVLGIICIVAVAWWPVIAVIDWLTFDFIPWYVEPFTFLLLIPYMMLYTEFGNNPITWWPLFWGTKVPCEMNDVQAVLWHATVKEKFGGARNVYCNVNYIKFRRQRDAVEYLLFHSQP